MHPLNHEPPVDDWTIASGRAARCYGAAAFLTAFLLIATVAAVNVAIDPFAMYDLWTIEGVNAAKPAVYERVRLFKAFEVRRVRPRAVIIGSSRAHVGLGCSHEAWSEFDGPCYNLAFDGATTREMHAFLRHAQAVRPLSVVVLALDTYHLIDGPAQSQPGFDPLILFDLERTRFLPLLTGDARLLTSLDTLWASLETVRGQRTGEPRWFAPDGQRLGEVYFRDVDGAFRELTPRGYFEKMEQLEIGYQTEGGVPGGQPTLSGTRPDTANSSFEYIRRMVEFCDANEIDLRIVITPAHAQQYEIAAAVGSWPSVQEAKRRIASVLAERGVATGETEPVPLWDFSGYSSVTTEPLPPSESDREMRFYWDASHFKREVGDYVLDRVFGSSSPGRTVPPDFGVELNLQTIDQALADQMAGQHAYRLRSPEAGRVRTLVGEILTKVRASRPGSEASS